MYKYFFDKETGGVLLSKEISTFSKEARPVFYRELDFLGFDKYYKYPQDEDLPIMWAEGSNYIYRGQVIAKTSGGSLYHKPTLNILIEDPEGKGQPLRPVDVQAMCDKNREIMEALVQTTVKKLYAVYEEYRKKVDVFHVSFSGGKDSVVLLDMVQRALPHKDFVVIFGDTKMEFSDTYAVVDEIEEYCRKENISFIRAASHLEPVASWRMFGPPSRVLRWCCNVHKTTPQLLALRDFAGKANAIEMALVGVRADESFKRRGYDFVCFSKEQEGQFSCNVILDWSSVEVFLHIFSNKLAFNELYKKGLARAGCLLCPFAGEKNDSRRMICDTKQVEKYADIIKDSFERDEDIVSFLEAGKWKARTNGRDLKQNIIRYFEEDKRTIIISFPCQNWQNWMKTVGDFVFKNGVCCFSRNGCTGSFSVEETKNGYKVILSEDVFKNRLVTCVKNVFRKAAYCVGCRSCEAQCPFGCLHFVKGKVEIDNSCSHCLSCSSEVGCLIYKSRHLPKGGNKK